MLDTLNHPIGILALAVREIHRFRWPYIMFLADEAVVCTPQGAFSEASFFLLLSIFRQVTLQFMK